MGDSGVGGRLRLALRLVLAAAFLYLMVDRILLRGREWDPPLLLGLGAAILYFVYLFARRRTRLGAGRVQAEDYHFDLHSDPPPRRDDSQS